MTHSQTLSERVVVDATNACDYCGFPELEVLYPISTDMAIWCPNCERHGILSGDNRLWFAAFSAWVWASTEGDL